MTALNLVSKRVIFIDVKSKDNTPMCYTIYTQNFCI